MSSLSLSHQPHASSSSSTPSATPQRRVTLTIKPLKLNASASGSSVDSSASSRDASASCADDRKPLPKIKIKASKPSIVNTVDSDAMEVDTPARAPSQPPVIAQPVRLPPPPPPPLPVHPARSPPPPNVKVPRPIKLKPLKEVLARLIAHIKKKDDYAFFLQPVDQSQIPGYSDVVKHPMDFGTMTEKVERGRYRSLEQFKDDFCLVTSNAKAFNPPSTLYHTEASKIETWGLEQISRAAAQVIEYETDWTIDVVADEEHIPTGVDLLDSAADSSVPPAEDDVGRSGPSRARSPSVLSSAAGFGSIPVERAKRSSRAKKVPGVTESWEEGGHLPGYKDGLAAFPSGSDFAALMIELKLRGKRFRTKKERLKREREGPPFAADGSLDYTEMENPFTILRNLAPDPPSVPHLIPLISTQPAPPEATEGTPEASQPPESKEDRQDDQANKPAGGPIYVPPNILPTILADSNRHAFANPPMSTSQIGNKKLRHWTITRNPPRGTRTRDDDEDGVAGGPQAKRRRVETPDYGAFAALLGTLAAENGLRADNFEEMFGNDEKILGQIRQSIECPSRPTQPQTGSSTDNEGVLDADEYIWEIVYGGAYGLAYFRSLAEFVGEYSGPLNQEQEASAYASSGALGMPLAQWVEMHIVDPLTRGNHAILRAAAEALARPQPDTHLSSSLTNYFALAAQDKTAAREKIRDIEKLTDDGTQIDIATLLHAPEELFIAENEWAGREREQAGQISIAPASGTSVNLETAAVAMKSSLGPGQSKTHAAAIEHALAVGAESLKKLGQRGDMNVNGASGDEDALVRRTRLNLIALAKRAPIDRIARLPPELVPLHIRHIVPTLGS